MDQSLGDRGGVWTDPSRLIVIILLAAFVLRVWGVWFGLPYVFHNDEGNEVLRALQLGTGQFNFQRIDKGVYFYLLFVEYGALFVVLNVLGIVNSAAEFGEYFIRDPSVFYLIGRVTTAIVGTATVFVVYKLGRLAYSTNTALIAAAMLTVNVLHAKLSHFVTVDVPLTFFATAALFFALRMIQGGQRRDYWLAAIMAALATATKTPGVLLLIPLVIAHFYAVRERGGSAVDLVRNVSLWQAAMFFLVVYVIANPGIVIHFDGAFNRYVGKFFGDEAGSRYIADEVLDERALFANINLFSYYLKVIIDSMTLPIFVICAGGSLYAAWRRRPADIVLLSFLLATYILLSLSNDPFQFFPRYMLPVLPVAGLLGSRLLADLIAGLPMVRKVVPIGLVTAALILMPIAQIVAANQLMTRTDTRAVAKDWFDENVEPGARVFIEGTTTEPSQGTVPLQNSAENLRKSIALYKDSQPGKAKYFRMLTKVQTGKTFDLVTVRPVELKSLEEYKADGVQYFVIRPDNYAGSRVKFHWPQLVEQLRNDPEVSLMQRFDPGDGVRPGPLIEVYRVDANIGEPNA